MAADENQPQHVIAEAVVVRLERQHVAGKRGLGLKVRALGAQPHLPADAVDRLMAADIHQPGARIIRNRAPLLERGRKCFLQHFLGKLEIADEADQGRENATPLVAEQVLDLLAAHPSLAPERDHHE